MTADASEAARAALDNGRVACLLAVDPFGLGGVALRAPAGPAREAWLQMLRDVLPGDMNWRRIPLNISQDRLLGGMDLAATLSAGRRVAQTGVLAGADGGVAVIAMAERLAPVTARLIGAALDTGSVHAERDGLSLSAPARFMAIACDEGCEDDERLCAALGDRLAFRLDLHKPAGLEAMEPEFDREDIADARAQLPGVEISQDGIEALCATALALGIHSARAALFAVSVARASAALCRRGEVGEDDLAVAGRLVLAPRATRLPPGEESAEPEEADTPPPEPQQQDPADPSATSSAKPLDDVVLDAVMAVLPASLLAHLEGAGAWEKHGASGRSGAQRKAATRGRPTGHRPGMPGAGARLDIIATLRQAAPWQRVRRTERGQMSGAGPTPLVEIRRDDLRIRRFAQTISQTTIFAVDASGSAALQRLGEAKGAVDLLLADCYIRRDRVALIAFRGERAELLLAPTRSLTRARRALSTLPGGGGTPLASGLDLAREVAEQIRRQDEIPVIVLLTDGGANIASDGRPGRPRAEADALAAGLRLKAAMVRSLLIDTALRPQPLARRIAEGMGAIYYPMPNADAASISRAARVLDERGPRSQREAGGR